MFVLVLGVMFIAIPLSYAQVNQNNTPTTKLDTSSVNQDTSTQKINSFKVIFNGKPGKAALYSLLIPGGGQLYNKKWWKAPLAWGIDGFFITNLVSKKQQYNDLDTRFKKFNADPSYVDDLYTKDQVQNFRSQVKGSVEYAWVYLIIGHLVTVFDAYVDRHLLDFDISDDISFKVKGNQDVRGNVEIAAFTYSF
jgi:hypothetical protein